MTVSLCNLHVHHPPDANLRELLETTDAILSNACHQLGWHYVYWISSWNHPGRWGTNGKFQWTVWHNTASSFPNADFRHIITPQLAHHGITWKELGIQTGGEFIGWKW